MRESISASSEGSAVEPLLAVLSVRSSGLDGEALPERLRRALEHLSGYDLADVRVHADSPWPARLGARAFAFGRDIHLAPGAEDALAHEAWHVVQQKQGRARATGSVAVAGRPLAYNEEVALEHEADLMALVARHLARRGSLAPTTRALCSVTPLQPVLQRAVRVGDGKF